MKVPVLHQTDIFHHHADPDDHWDLACQFALAYTGEIDLKGILIDYPPAADFFGMDCGDPAIAAVAQMNYITGQAVPIGIGTERKAGSDDEALKIAKEKVPGSGLNLLVKTLREAEEPVIIHIVGSCRDVAIAAKAYPELFKRKCGAVYLNAGAGSGDILEYNVALDPYAYSVMFDLPCPLYWMPCFHNAGKMEIGEYGTYYHFQQKKILPYLSEDVQKYFAYALGRVSDQRWLTYLKLPKNDAFLQAHGNLWRNMWCTAGFFHMVGKTVTSEGIITASVSSEIKPVFEFLPIEVECEKNGRTRWRLTDKCTERFIFRVTDINAYENAMTEAMKNLLMKLL
ncbi:hypothetical protein [Eisenbergiella porci]|uniref:hypothetical protein n=1 Tax=Eisenbergiella porci TaxID=2652274 RepID=UPI002A80BD13|nr:hypothetical protein [Eisenbergiella porci]